MKKTSKVISSLIFFILTVTDILAIVFSLIFFCISLKKTEGTDAALISDEFAYQLFLITNAVILAIMAIIAAVFLFIKTYFYTQALKRRSYGFFLSLSITGIVEVIISPIMVYFVFNRILDLRNIPYDPLEICFFILIGAYIVSAVLLVPGTVLSNRLAKEESFANITF